MTLRINKIHWPVNVLGYGRRIGVWTQGCSLHCPHCCSQDTWETDAGILLHTEELLAACLDLLNGESCDGFTVSGGEPFEQADGLLEFLRAARAWARQSWGDNHSDFLCYSGLPLERLRSAHSAVLAELDAVIADPFVHTRPADVLRGSDNQRYVALSPLGEARRLDVLQQPVKKRLQFQLDAQHLWLVGIPAPGDLERLRAECARRGLVLRGVSWRE